MCCGNQEESSNHILFLGKWAREWWRYFSLGLGVNPPRCVGGFIHRFLLENPEKSFFKSFSLGIACCGIWELWLRRNAARHESRVYDFNRNMRGWMNNLVKAIPSGVCSNEERRRIEAIGAKVSAFQRRRKGNWKHHVAGPIAHLAIHSSSDSKKGSIIIRNNEGKLLFAECVKMREQDEKQLYCALVRRCLKKIEELELGKAHIFSSESCAINCDAEKEWHIPWEMFLIVCDWLEEFERFSLHKTSLNNNIPATCLAVQGEERRYISLADLPIAVRMSIIADQYGLTSQELLRSSRHTSTRDDTQIHFNTD